MLPVTGLQVMISFYCQMIMPIILLQALQYCYERDS